MEPVNTYAIVGAGFSGIACAVQLLRRLRAPAVIHLVNRNHRFGRGLAYGTRSGSHLLNVPAARMGLDPHDETGFLRFLQEQGAAVRPGDFVPRKLYGEYLEACLEQAQQTAAPGVRLEMVQAEIDDIQGGEGGRHLLHLSDGRHMAVDEVVLALGNFAPRPPGPAAALGDLPQLVNDPWALARPEVPPDARVLLLGSGLTAYDVVLGLLDRGHRGPVVMLSRRGLLPQPHRQQEFRTSAPVIDVADVLRQRTPRGALHALRAAAARATAAGHDWRDAVAAIRGGTPQLWQQFDERARRQFMRHLMPYWDTHRHRAAPDIDRRVRAAVAAGQLEHHAARVVAMAAADGAVAVQWRPRGRDDVVSRPFDLVVNCTGPSADVARSGDPLMRALCGKGWLKPDNLALGIEVDPAYRVLASDGAPVPGLRYVGPMLKAQNWEAIAVPELRVHASRLAQLLADAGSRVPRPQPIS